VTIVNNNSSLGQCSSLAHLAYDETSGKPHELYRFTAIDFAQIARDMGCVGIRVKKADQISDALQSALSSDEPTVIDVVTDPRSAAPAPWHPQTR